jgi:hypothetical protein
MTTTLYRAADDDYISQGTCFASGREAAESYLDNPGFGGDTLWACEAEGRVLDLTGSYWVDALCEALEGHDDAEALQDSVRTDSHLDLCEVIHHRIALMDALAESYDWIQVDETYPAGTVTWIWLGSDADEPEMAEAEAE